MKQRFLLDQNRPQKLPTVGEDYIANVKLKMH